MRFHLSLARNKKIKSIFLKSVFLGGRKQGEMTQTLYAHMNKRKEKKNVFFCPVNLRY
jgi:hypothetical protein